MGEHAVSFYAQPNFRRDSRTPPSKGFSLPPSQKAGEFP